MSRTTKRMAGAVAAAAVAGLAIAPAAFAADGPGVATAKLFEMNVVLNDAAANETQTFKENSIVFDTKTEFRSAWPEVGMGQVYYRLNAVTQRHIIDTSVTDPANPYKSYVAVKTEFPQTGTLGVPELMAQANAINMSCTPDSQGNNTYSYSVTNPSAPIGSNPAPNTVTYLPAGSNESNYMIKTVWNEQTTLANGQVQMTGMHSTYRVPQQMSGGEAVANGGALTGDIKYSIITCGKVTNAPDPAPIPIADPKLASGVAGAALIAGFVAMRRRKAQEF